MNRSLDKNTPVAISRAEAYEFDSVFSIIKKHFSLILADNDLIKNKNVVIKPNLLLKSSPDKCITTHPVVLEAVIEALKEYSPASLTIAESPGGPYSSAALSIIYRSTGIAQVADKTKINLNYDTSAENVSNPHGEVCKVFNIISPIKKADLIVDVCKLKTHSLTTMSGAVKNLFGTIPGIEKFEMHTRFKEPKIFESMLVDLCSMHCERVPVLSIMDGIYGMEGNGPSGGDVRRFDLLMSSLNPFNLDIAASTILGMENEVYYLEKAKERGFCVDRASELAFFDGNIADFKAENVKLPDTKSLKILRILPTMLGGKVNKFFEPRPDIIKTKCIGCGECMRSCPAKTIELAENKNGKKIALIHREKCIKCYCCQELCPIHAVKVKKNFIFKIIR